MLERVRILHGLSQYDVWDRWEHALADAFRQRGIDARIIPADALAAEPHAEGLLSLGFNLVRTWSPDNARIRHLAWLVDHPVFHKGFFHPVASPLHVDLAHCALGTVDLNWQEYIRSIYRFPHVALLPHAATVSGLTDPDWRMRELDAVMFGSIADPRDHRAQLERAAGSLWPMIETLLARLEQPPPVPADLGLWHMLSALGNRWEDSVRLSETLLPHLDKHLRNLGRLALLKRFARTTVHVYGLGPWGTLGLPRTVAVHRPVPYLEALEIMRHAKVVLNHTPTLRNGAHERVLDALACGCAVLTTHSDFLKREFGDEAGIRSFEDTRTEGIEETLRGLLADPDTPARVRQGQAIVDSRHRMANRADAILRFAAERWPDPSASPPAGPAGSLNP